jgi:hypothetical protein
MRVLTFTIPSAVRALTMKIAAASFLADLILNASPRSSCTGVSSTADLAPITAIGTSCGVPLVAGLAALSEIHRRRKRLMTGSWKRVVQARAVYIPA